MSQLWTVKQPSPSNITKHLPAWHAQSIGEIILMDVSLRFTKLLTPALTGVTIVASACVPSPEIQGKGYLNVGGWYSFRNWL